MDQGETGDDEPNGGGEGNGVGHSGGRGLELAGEIDLAGLGGIGGGSRGDRLTESGGEGDRSGGIEGGGVGHDLESAGGVVGVGDGIERGDREGNADAITAALKISVDGGDGGGKDEHFHVRGERGEILGRETERSEIDAGGDENVLKRQIAV